MALKSFGSSDTPEQKAWELEVRRKGQQAQAEQRRRKTALRDILDTILVLDCDTSTLTDDELTEKVQQLAREQGRSVSLYEAIALSQIRRAIDGDTKAATFVRDSAGDKPVDRSEISTDEVMTSADRELLANISKRLGIDPTEK